MKTSLGYSLKKFCESTVTVSYFVEYAMIIKLLLFLFRKLGEICNINLQFMYAGLSGTTEG